MNDHSVLSLSAGCTSMKACCSLTGVGATAASCTARYSGSSSESRARSCVVKSHTCMDGGQLAKQVQAA